MDLQCSLVILPAVVSHILSLLVVRHFSLAIVDGVAGRVAWAMASPVAWYRRNGLRLHCFSGCRPVLHRVAP